MKLQRMTWGRWFELLFGSVAVIFLFPFMLMALLVPIAILGEKTGASTLFLRFQEILVALAIGLAGLVGFVAWVSLTLLILFGPEQLAQKSSARQTLIGIGLAGLLVSGFLLVRSVSDWQLLLQRDLPLVLPLLGCFAVGLRYTIILVKKR